jgi:hypothetical protein
LNFSRKSKGIFFGDYIDSFVDQNQIVHRAGHTFFIAFLKQKDPSKIYENLNFALLKQLSM